MPYTEQQKSKLLIIGFVSAVLLVVVLYFHFIVGRGQERDFQMRTKRISKEIAESRAELAEIKELMKHESRLEEQRQLIAKLVQRLPGSPDAPGFLTALVSMIRTTGIIQDTVKPEKLQSRAQYTEIPYTVEAFGRYHELGQFLTLVEQNPQRFMRVKSFTVENSLERPSIHPIKMEIATFMFTN